MGAEKLPTDQVELTFPIEYNVVDEVPVSLQASSASKTEWKGIVEKAARKVIQQHCWAVTQPVSVTILYFPEGKMQGDIDNIVKPILDAMQPYIYLDDKQVERVWAQRFEHDRPRAIVNPSTMLASALDCDPPVLYVRVDIDESLA